VAFQQARSQRNARKPGKLAFADIASFDKDFTKFKDVILWDANG